MEVSKRTWSLPLPVQPWAMQVAPYLWAAWTRWAEISGRDRQRAAGTCSHTWRWRRWRKRRTRSELLAHVDNSQATTPRDRAFSLIFSRPSCSWPTLPRTAMTSRFISSCNHLTQTEVSSCRTQSEHNFLPWAWEIVLSTSQAPRLLCYVHVLPSPCLLRMRRCGTSLLEPYRDMDVATFPASMRAHYCSSRHVSLREKKTRRTQLDSAEVILACGPQPPCKQRQRYRRREIARWRRAALSTAFWLGRMAHIAMPSYVASAVFTRPLLPQSRRNYQIANRLVLSING